MKNLIFSFALLLFGCAVLLSSCQTDGSKTEEPAAAAIPAGGGQANVKDDDSAPNVVKIAVNSPDHTTLVAALKAADLVNALANAGPFTVFAPNDDAFKALPAGTVEGLLKPEKKDDLYNILTYHVTTSALSEEMLQDGQLLGMVNGGKATIHKKDGKTMINDATVLGVVKATNGMVYVVDKVLLPN